MKKTDIRYQAYIQILREELIPAMGCTEPIAIAYGAAIARETLGAVPDRVVVEASGSIIKNVKSVIVPNTDHQRGIPAAAAAGIIAGNASRGLEVISGTTKEQIEQMKEFIEHTDIKVKHVDNDMIFDIIITVFREDSWAKAWVSRAQLSHDLRLRRQRRHVPLRGHAQKRSGFKGYVENRHGVRTENLMVCKNGEKNTYGQFMEFECLTFVPIDLDGLDPRLMEEEDIRHLNEYHRQVREKISPYLTKEEALWLRQATRTV